MERNILHVLVSSQGAGQYADALSAHTRLSNEWLIDK